MPPIWDRAFSERFYARWGRENAVVSASTRRAYYPDYTQLLSIKMICGGSEDYFVDGRRLSVDDDTFLILNAGRRYRSCIDSISPARSFSIFFRPGLAQEVQDCLGRSTESLLDDPASDRANPMEFGEHLREHEPTVSAVLRYIQTVVDGGLGSEAWLEEQLQFLFARMLKLERTHWVAQQLVPSSRPATRRELARRLALAADFMHTHFQDPIQLGDIARASHLSPFHFLRTFKVVYGMTPSMYLARKRVNAALRLIHNSTWTLTEIAEHVGFGSRTTLFRHLRESRSIDAAYLGSRAALEAPAEI